MKRLDGITDSTDMSLTRCPARRSPYPSPSCQPSWESSAKGHGPCPLWTVGLAGLWAPTSKRPPTVWTGTWGWAQGSPILLARDQT